MDTRESPVALSGYTTIKGCRLCGGGLRTVIDFGQMPLANGYTRSTDEVETLYPLTLVSCEACGHYQILETVDPRILFSSFLYATGDSPTLVGHFRKYAEEVVELMGGSGFRVLEIASNDGVLVRSFEDLGVAGIVGVEPAANLVEIARSRTKAEYVNEFFGKRVGEDLRGEGGFDVITANNVMAHVADLDGVFGGIDAALGDDGIFIFENAYLLDTINNHCYDNTYHEHLQYYGISPLVGYLRRHGLEFFDIRHQETQSGSFRGFVKRMGSQKWAVRPSVGEFLARERKAGLYEDSTIDRYRSDFAELYGRLGDIVSSETSGGRTLSCYGCSAKFTMLGKTLGLDRTNTMYVVDDARMKQGLLAPGGKIPIVGRDTFVNQPTDCCVISAWNLADPIVKNNPQYSGKFILPVPSPRVL